VILRIFGLIYLIFRDLQTQVVQNYTWIFGIFGIFGLIYLIFTDVQTQVVQNHFA